MFRRKGGNSGVSQGWKGFVKITDLKAGDAHCVYPRCSNKATEQARIATNSSSDNARNISLCHYHGQNAVENPGIAEFLYQLEDYATAAQRMVKNSAGGELRQLSREEYIDRATTYLQSTDYFMGAYLASCFHPDWLLALQFDAERRKVAPSPGSSAMDRAVKSLLSRDRPACVRIILRLSEQTYAGKVSAITTDSRLIAIAIEDTCSAIEEFYSRPSVSQQVTSFKIGHERMPYIFRDCVITAQRTAPTDPVDYAILSTDAQVVEFEQRSFELLFEQCVRPVDEEKETLISFVRSALGGLT